MKAIVISQTDFDEVFRATINALKLELIESVHGLPKDHADRAFRIANYRICELKSRLEAK